MDPVKGRLFSKQMQSATLPRLRDMIVCLVQWARVELAVLVAAGLQPTGVTNFPTIAYVVDKLQ